MNVARASLKRPRQEDEVERRKKVQHRVRREELSMEVEERASSTAPLQSSQDVDLHVGAPAPHFTCDAVLDQKFKRVSLEDYYGKFVVILFYPMDFTFVCPTEIMSFAKRISEFHAIGCEVLGCSTDSKFTHLAWTQTPRAEGGVDQITFPLLADKSMSLSRKYRVLNEAEGVAYRTLIIIDDKRKIREIIANDNSVGRSVDETLRLIQALQFADKHGQVCPAGWKPGDKAIDPNEKKMDFSRA
ncbi:peroxiredoxin-2-like [Panulirus ornatus]|uniref:peroxiredoxin-2-like n=1 Tax=Panulirus ornatus TaxID=150431 RepID=UPI003A8916DD